MGYAGDISAMKGNDPGSGGHRSGSTSLAAITATLIPTLITAVVFLALFVSLRKPYRSIYSPRTYFSTIPEKDRTPSSSGVAVGWFRDFLKLDDGFVLRHHSLDAYLYLRFFRIITVICFVGCCLTWPILIPVNVTGGGKASQLDRLSFSNVKLKGHMYAHAIVAWVYLGFVILLLTRERLFAIGLRQAYFTSKAHSARLSQRVVLFLSVPLDATKEDSLKRYFGNDALRSWAVNDLQEVEGLVSERDDHASKLEGTEMQLIHKVVKSQTKGSSQNHNDGGAVLNGNSTRKDYTECRPTHRPMFGMGTKVDTIDWERKRLSEVVANLKSTRTASKSSHARSPALFVEYKDQASAQRAYQNVIHQSPLSFQPRFVGVTPKQVLWHNLTINPSLRITYSYLAIASVILTTIFWAIPVGIVGTISNIDYLAEQFKFLAFINNLPESVLGLLTGLLPPLAISTLVSYVPTIFRYIAKLSGAPTTVEAEKITQTWYFIFQVIQIFLVTTFSSGATRLARKVANDPSSVPILLAQNLPSASNFYLSYFLLQGVANAAKYIINYSDLGMYVIYDYFFDTTPRQKYNRLSSMKGISWGSVYPKFTNFVVIAIAYSCIAPLMLGFATIGLFLLYCSYRYNLLYTIQVKTDTGGECYRAALQHLLVGVYLSELCLLGLFSLKKAPGPSVLMTILLIATIIHNITVNRYLSPMEKYMPLDILSGQTSDEDDEEQALLTTFNTPLDTEDSDSRPQRSLIHRSLGKALPAILIDPLAQFLEPHIFASQEALRPWLSDPLDSDESMPAYSDDEIKNAYVNPAMTSKTPKIWLARDALGVSRSEVKENEEAGLESTDDGATIDEKAVVEFDKEDWTGLPVFKLQKQY